MRSDSSRRDLLGPGLLLAALALLLWRCTLTFCWSDEGFYLALAHRFWLGDLPFVDEWNTAQLYAPFLLPFYALWRAITGGTTGIYLAARVAAVLLQFALAFALYRALRPRGRGTALAASLLVLVYAKAGIGGLSYYTLCYLFFGTGLLLFYFACETASTARMGLCFAAGAVMALAVVCMPYLAVLWVLPVVFLLLPSAHGRRGPVLAFLGGTGAAALVYLAWLLHRVSLSELLEYLPFVLMDPDGSSTSLPVLALKALVQPFYQFRFGLLFWGGALAASLLLPRLRQVNSVSALPAKVRRLLLSAALAGFAVNLLTSGDMLGKAHLALCLLAVQGWLLTPPARRPVREALCFFLPGWAFGLVWQVGSNTGFSGMTLGFALACAGAAPMVGACLHCLREEGVLSRSTGRALAALTLCVPVLLSGWQRLALEYRDAPLSQCTQRLTSGPAAGLVTTPEHAAQYTAICRALTESESDGPVFVTALAPWAYLCTDRPMGTSTSWRTYLDSELLEVYYRQHPERFPTTVLVLDEAVGGYTSTLQPEENPLPNQNSGREDGFLTLELARRGFTAHTTPVGTVYEAG